MVFLSSTSSGLEFWLVNHTSTYENPESKVFRNMKFWGGISNSWPKDLFGINVNNSLESCW